MLESKMGPLRGEAEWQRLDYLEHCLQKGLSPPETPVSSGESGCCKNQASPSLLSDLQLHVFPLSGGHTLWVPHQSQAEVATKLLGLQDCELTRSLFLTDDLASGILVQHLDTH